MTHREKLLSAIPHDADCRTHGTDPVCDCTSQAIHGAAIRVLFDLHTAKCGDTELIEAADRAMRATRGGIDFDYIKDSFYVSGNDAYGVRIRPTLRAALEAIVEMGEGR